MKLAAALLHLYEKHVPAAVREYIDEDDGCSGKAEAHNKTGSAEKLKHLIQNALQQVTLRQSLQMEVRNRSIRNIWDDLNETKQRESCLRSRQRQLRCDPDSSY